MASKGAHESDFVKAKECLKTYRCFVALSIAASIITAILGVLNCSNTIVDALLTVITVFSLMAVFRCKRAFNTHFQKAEQTRREGLLDDSFDTRMADTPSEKYYDTDDIGFGLGKLLANTHENSMFTASIADEMIKGPEWRFVAGIALLIVLAVFNLLKARAIVAVVDILITHNVLNDYLDLKELRSEAVTVQEKCKDAATAALEEHWKLSEKTNGKIINAFLRYETALSYASIILSQKVYDRMNDDLTKKWEGIKKRYYTEEVSADEKQIKNDLD